MLPCFLSSHLKGIDAFLLSSKWLILVNVYVHMKRMCFLLLLGGVVYKCQLEWLLIVLLEFSLLLLIFCLHVLSVTKRGMLQSPTWICMPLNFYQLIQYTLKVLLYECTFRVAKSSRLTDLPAMMKHPSLSLEFPLF